MRVRAAALALAGIAILGIGAGAVAGKSDPYLGGGKRAGFVLKAVTNVTQVAQLTGADSINRTGRYGVYGTDLGSMFNAGRRTYLLFGDTFGVRAAGTVGAGGQNWRSGTIAYTTTRDPAHGLKLAWITGSDGVAKELLSSLQINNVEVTKIPTTGVSVGDTLYVYYMSVNHFGAPGVWVANYAGIAKSVDGGQNWQFVKGARWPGDSNFIQFSAYKVQIRHGAEIYLWGIPAGRFGGVKLMRVSAASVADVSSYQYFSGLNSEGRPVWSSSMKRAVKIVGGPVGELSVIWDPWLGRWIMMYLEGVGNVVMREGITPWGPWGRTITVAAQAEYPGLYGPFMDPRYLGNDGEYVYFDLSRWGPYNVFWMRAKLVKAN